MNYINRQINLPCVSKNKYKSQFITWFLKMLDKYTTTENMKKKALQMKIIYKYYLNNLSIHKLYEKQLNLIKGSNNHTRTEHLVIAKNLY